MAKQRRYAHKPGRIVPAQPFPTTEAAWFWFTRCLRLRREGARFEADRSRVSRPCDPDDIAAVVTLLVRQHVLGRPHIRVLAAYGLLSRPPDPRDRSEARDSLLWAAALDRLSSPLRAKGIVDVPTEQMSSVDRTQRWGVAAVTWPGGND